MRINDETIDYVSILAKLDLHDEEKEKAKKDMDDMLGFIEKMNEIDTSEVEPMTHIFEMGQVFREDIVVNTDKKEEILSNAPKTKNNMFHVPKTVE